MKKLMLGALLLGLVMSSAQAGVAFGVKPGMVINAAYMGIKLGDLVPFCNLEAGRVKSVYESRSKDGVGEIYESEFSILALMPQIGMKMFLGRRDVRPYLQGAVFTTLASVTVLDDGTHDETTEEMIEDYLTGLYGFCLGGGCEYFFAEGFSVGGEVDLRYFHADTEYPTNYRIESYTQSLSISYTAIGLNFYF